jgi:hypothetical protein
MALHTPALSSFPISVVNDLRSYVSAALRASSRKHVALYDSSAQYIRRVVGVALCRLPLGRTRLGRCAPGMLNVLGAGHRQLGAEQCPGDADQQESPVAKADDLVAGWCRQARVGQVRRPIAFTRVPSVGCCQALIAGALAMIEVSWVGFSQLAPGGRQRTATGRTSIVIGERGPGARLLKMLCGRYRL